MLSGIKLRLLCNRYGIKLRLQARTMLEAGCQRSQAIMYYTRPIMHASLTLRFHRFIDAHTALVLHVYK